MYKILDCNSDLQAVLHGTQINKVPNLLGLYNRAARQLLLDIDPQETKRITQTTTPIYNQIFDYTVPVDLKGNKIADIFPQVQRSSGDVYLQDFNQDFDIKKTLTNQDQFTVLFNSGIKTMRIAAPALTAPIVINQASSTSTNGTWTTGGGATGLTVDNTNYVDGGGSLQFNLSAGQSTGYLENSTMSPLDLTKNLNQATNFLYVYLPTASSISAVEFRLGSDASNYYVLSTSITQQNTIFLNGWNLLQFPWSSMTKVGSPVITSIDYVRVTYSYDSTLQTAVRLNDILSTVGTILNLSYYSKYMFRTSAGVWQETTTATDYSDLINLDTESYNLFLNLVGHLAGQYIQGLDAMFYDANFFMTSYQEGLKRYKAMYKSDVQLPQSQYYQPTNPSYTNGFVRTRLV